MKRHLNEDGFVLVTGLMILVILTLIGIAATRNTTIELQIAGNDRLHKETFYEAEAGAIFGSELLEQNFNCGTGFASTGTATFSDPPEIPAAPRYRDIKGYVRAWERLDNYSPPTAGNPNGLAFWRNPDRRTNINDAKTLNLADASYPIANLDPTGTGNATLDLPGTGYIYMGGFTEMMPGGALQMAAGYEGKGKGSASGGVAKIIDIYSRFQGALDSESIILFGWRHVIGSEGDCEY